MNLPEKEEVHELISKGELTFTALLPDGKFIPMSTSVRNSNGDVTALLSRHDSAALSQSLLVPNQAAAKVLAELPNDLARLIYLASIRDCNTGVYLQPNLSHCYGVALVDGILKFHHERVFQSLLETPVSAYVDQLGLYISFVGATRAQLIETWKDLKAYKSAIPLHSDKLAVEVFCLNVGTALCILDHTG